MVITNSQTEVIILTVQHNLLYNIENINKHKQNPLQNSGRLHSGYFWGNISSMVFRFCRTEYFSVERLNSPKRREEKCS